MPEVDRAIRVFVSYVYAEAKEFATEAKQVFENEGYSAWVWHHDHRPIGYAKREMREKPKVAVEIPVP